MSTFNRYNIPINTLLFIKFGGSVITNKKKAYTAEKTIIERLSKEIHNARKTYTGNIIIGHGSGSFAHTPAAKYQTKKGLIQNDSLYGMSVVEDAARQLNMIVIHNLLAKKIPAFSFSPASFILAKKHKLHCIFTESIKKALDIGIVPVVYGDVILDERNGCTIFSTETIFSELISEFYKQYKIRVIYVSNTDGVYDEKGITIAHISSKNFSTVKRAIGGSDSVDVTGGMLHKVEESIRLANQYHLEIQIINGNRTGYLERAIAGIELPLTTKIQ